jgi:hypothetical protein
MNRILKKISPVSGVVCLFLFVILWGIGIPFGGVADEPVYLQYGINSVSNVVGTTDGIQRSTLQNISLSPCFAFHPEVSANCQNFSTDKGQVVARAPLARYPRIWFYLTAWPAMLVSGQLGLVLAKLMASLLSVGVLLIAAMNWQKDKRLLSIVTLVSLPPLSIQMLGSYNPNGFEIAGVAATAIMLFGRSLPGDFQPKNWWLSLIGVSLLSSSAKPMTGVLIFLCYCAFFTYLYLTTNPGTTTISRIRILVSRNNYRLALIAITSFLCSYILTLPSLHDASKVLKPTNVSALHTLFTFLLKSENYAQEYAGIFGWRDIGSAPWGITIWGGILAIIVYLSLQGQPRQAIAIISLVWVAVLIVAPAFESISLSRNYNVGLQTRYLGGIYAVGIIFTCCLIRDLYEKARFLIPILVLINIVQFAWVYLRFAIGYPTYLIQPHQFFQELTSNSTWRPLLVGVVITIVGIILATIIMSMGFSEGNGKVNSGYVAVIVAVISIAIGVNAQSRYKDYKPQPQYGAAMFDIEPAKSPIGELSGSTVVEQSFIPPADGLTALKIELATYARTNSGSLTIEVLNEHRKTIFHKVVLQKTILDNAYYPIDFETQKTSKGKEYFLRLIANGSPVGKSITAWSSNSTVMKGFHLKINGKEIPSTLVFKGLGKL